MTPRGVLIEDRRRLSLAFRWRDRCLTVALWGTWWIPFDAIRNLAAIEAFRWSAFVADLSEVLSVAAAAVGLLLAWGTYGHWREASEGEDGVPSRRPAEISPMLGTSSKPALDHTDTRT